MKKKQTSKDFYPYGRADDKLCRLGATLDL